MEKTNPIASHCPSKLENIASHRIVLPLHSSLFRKAYNYIPFCKALPCNSYLQMINCLTGLTGLNGLTGLTGPRWQSSGASCNSRRLNGGAPCRGAAGAACEVPGRFSFSLEPTPRSASLSLHHATRSAIWDRYPQILLPTVLAARERCSSQNQLTPCHASLVGP